MAARRQRRRRQSAKQRNPPEGAIEKTSPSRVTGRHLATDSAALRNIGAEPSPNSHTATAQANAAPRTVILHYHLFKNAGTSIDELLGRNFGARWTSQEFAINRRENGAAVANFIRSNPHVRAISSHTALLPRPRVEGIEIFPIIFIRHPIDRLRSAYEFERRQNANTAGARLAKTHDFGGYLRVLLGNPRHRQIRNFQTFRLADNEPRQKHSELERAIAAIQSFPFVGLVERFDESVKKLEICLQRLVPEFRVQSVHRNASLFRQAALADRLKEVTAMLGEELYEKICAANADDLTIYNRVVAEFEAG